MDKSKPKIVVISTLNYSGKNKLQILILEIKVLIFATKKVDIAIIDIDSYCTTCKLKEAQVFDISIKDLEY